MGKGGGVAESACSGILNEALEGETMGFARLSPLASPKATREVLEAHGLATKKALGQNFLVNDAILQKIVALAELSPADRVLEVGPGIGTLTIALLKSAGSVLSIERDTDLPAVLAETCAPWADRFILINKDALDLALEDFECCAGGRAVGSGCAHQASSAATETVQWTVSQSEDCLSDWALPEPASNHLLLPNKFVANLPYAVAATLVLDYFQRFPFLESATVMVQKEVADRMTAQPGTKNYGAYTVKLRLHAEPAGRFLVGPNNFFPPPRVDSSVLRLNRRPLLDDRGNPVSAQVIEAASLMADAAFASRRKTIANSCKTYFMGRGETGMRAAEMLPSILDAAGIDARRRGETLSLDEFVALGKAYLSVLA